MNRNFTRVAAALGATTIAVGSATAGYLARGSDDSSPAAAKQTRTAAATTANPAAVRSSLTVNAIYRGARDGVVEVLAAQQAADSPFPGGGSGAATAQGSGFVYDAEGHVVTNEHVVEDATSVRVRFADGKTVSATVVGADPSTDVAVLKVSTLPANSKPLEVADSSKVEVGDGVVAIGSPFGLSETVTTGIVSALNRELSSPNDYAIEGAIQTDAAINHGNSGGPLLDMQGRVIGVNSQIKSDSGGNDGVGFAIPSKTVKSIADRLIAGGSVEHAYLGVSIDDAATGGAHVGRVSSGTPAAQAGVQAGDVITSFDGQKIESAQDLRLAVDAHQPGDAVTVTVRRAGETKTLHATLATRPAA